MTLPQEFPRDLALLRLEDVLPQLSSTAAERYRAVFEARRADPLSPHGVLLIGSDGLRPLMALMRLVVLRFRDLNFERFAQHGSEGRYLSAYLKGTSLKLPLPERANGLFIERADQAPAAVAAEAAEALKRFPAPLFVTWEGVTAGPIWEALRSRSEVVTL